MKNTIKINESQLKALVMESARKVLNELNLMDMPLGDFYTQNAWWKEQVDNDFPNHGIANSRDWKETYFQLSSAKDEREKTKKKIDLQKRKEAKAARQEWLGKFRGFFQKALDWAIEGADENLPDYDEYLHTWPVVINVEGARRKIGKVKVDAITTNGYGGLLETKLGNYDIEFVGCQIYLKDDNTVGVELENVVCNDKDETCPIFDVEATKEMLRKVFTTKMRENASYLANKAEEESEVSTLAEQKVNNDLDSFYHYVVNRFNQEHIEIGDAGDVEELYQGCSNYNYETEPFDKLYQRVKADWIQYKSEQ